MISNLLYEFDYSEHTFADVGNLDHCIKYLNQTLVTFGFPASLDLFATDPVRNLCFICGSLFELCFLCVFDKYSICFLFRFRLHGLAIVCTHCCSKGNAISNFENLLMTSANGKLIYMCVSVCKCSHFAYTSHLLEIREV